MRHNLFKTLNRQLSALVILGKIVAFCVVFAQCGNAVAIGTPSASEVPTSKQADVNRKLPDGGIMGREVLREKNVNARKPGGICNFGDVSVECGAKIGSGDCVRGFAVAVENEQSAKQSADPAKQPEANVADVETKGVHPSVWILERQRCCRSRLIVVAM